jgi:D-sedoheptulose 7-phosphate isomerase
MSIELVTQYLSELEAAIHRLSTNDIVAVVDHLFDAWRHQRTIFIIGNGGSAATASHIMNDLNKYAHGPGQRRFRALALTDNVSLLTAVANDADYASVFVEPLRNFLRPGDVVVALSTSGDSRNIIAAVEFAKTAGASVIGLCGNRGGRLAELADLKVLVPADRIGQQEDVHLILNHVIAEALRRKVTDCAP